MKFFSGGRWRLNSTNCTFNMNEWNENGKKIFAWKYRFHFLSFVCYFLFSSSHKNVTNFFHLLYDTFQGLMNKSQKLKVKHFPTVSADTVIWSHFWYLDGQIRDFLFLSWWPATFCGGGKGFLGFEFDLQLIYISFPVVLSSCLGLIMFKFVYWIHVLLALVKPQPVA